MSVIIDETAWRTYKGQLEALRADDATSRQIIADLELELQGHRRAWEDLRNFIDAHRACGPDCCSIEFLVKTKELMSR